MNRTPEADVIVPVYRDTAMTLRCLRSVLDRSGPALRRLIAVNDASPEPDMAAALESLSVNDQRVLILHNEANLGFVGTCNRGLEHRQGDAVLLNSDTVVTAGWLLELAEVAHTDDRTGCVAPLSNNATICSVPQFCADTPAELVDADTVRTACARLPRSTIVPTGVGFCLYLRGDVLDVVGDLDPVFLLGYNEENDWAMRAQAMGFIARRANRAFVWHHGSMSFLEHKTELDARNARILSERHPHYLPQVQRFCASLDGPLAAHAVRVQMTGTIRVGLDLRHVPPADVGTTVYAAKLARMLAAYRDVDLTLIVRQDVQAAGLPGRVVFEDKRISDLDLIHKPGQVFEVADLELLFSSPAHVVISHLDQIAYRAQSVFGDQPSAERFRSTGFLALQSAQGVIAISRHAKEEIVREFGLPDDAVHVTPLGVDRDVYGQGPANDLAIRAGLGVSGPYFLSVATDYPHKNLPNLLDAYDLFRRRWTGGIAPALVLIGHKTAHPRGFYRQLAGRGDEGVIYLGAVKHEELLALYHGATALVYPSVYEGFGLPLLEAMAAGAPVVALPFSSVPEVGGDSILYPDGSSPKAIARALGRLCGDPELRADLIARGLRRAEQFAWDRTARLTIDVYRSVVFAPSERSLTARRHLLEVMASWARPTTVIHVPVPVPVPTPPEPTPPVGIRAACQLLDLAVKRRARREMERIKPGFGRRSA
jgi:glycosyltransferase involved in cell wall biosynthesis